ncbi:RagB/SusD family nutrient uptake outer membrane protein [Parapedobacter indicus]|uniref:Starch-binding associating with outer membrane n=1 Tax=Parapedobacter indicus TaxID=1477437 RepID=A0A1I3PLN4_9SPHI|nr:RagB/SusD family nutrient uptake outer membrane protein [Parapedobacter indicus]PPL00493.1 putative outer membrane starch-binding protein [Parapedobacter indicus]SFJ22221.1 Starch-binding associating with outer membrane [Parapedobacter indicus]
MRNILYKAVIFLFMTSGMMACKLDETVYSSIFSESYYKTASDAEKALVSAYGAMSALYSGPAALLVPDFSDDQTYPRAVVGRNTLTLFTVEPTYTTQRSQGRIMESPERIWTACYEGIERANWIIAKVPEADMDETRKKQIIGEAHFLRAFYHWMLTKNFGEIPVRTTPSTKEEEAYTPKSPLNEVYQQIYSDLDIAYDSGLPSFPAVEPGRPSREAVNALYAKAALYNEDWAVALEKAESVLNSQTYALLDNVVDLFRHDNEEDARREMMWAYEVDPISPGNGHQMVGLTGPSGSGGVEYGRTTYGSMFAYMDFFMSFEEGDERRMLLDTTYLNKAGEWVPQRQITPITEEGVLIKKYQDPVSTTSSTRNIPIFRLADIYLIAAEAEAHLNGPSTKAYGYVNSIRDRAGLEDLAAGLSETDFIDAVIQERAWEFFAEGDRWYDLTRTGKFLEVIPNAVNDVYPERNVQPKNRYFPIPQDEINANPELTQNPDWN